MAFNAEEVLDDLYDVSGQIVSLYYELRSLVGCGANIENIPIRVTITASARGNFTFI